MSQEQDWRKLFERSKRVSKFQQSSIESITTNNEHKKLLNKQRQNFGKAKRKYLENRRMTVGERITNSKPLKGVIDIQVRGARTVLAKKLLTPDSNLDPTNLKQAYRYYGKSITLSDVDGEPPRFSLDIFYEGKFVERYDIVFGKDKDENLILKYHNIPYWIPIEDIAAKFLTQDVKIFINVVYDFLSATTYRRHQLRNLNKSHPEINTFSTDMVDRIKFSFSWINNSYKFHFKYENLNSEIPSSVTILKNNHSIEVPSYFLTDDILPCLQKFCISEKEAATAAAAVIDTDNVELT